MNTETAQYIIKYFPHLLTAAERMAILHTSSTYKLEHATVDKPHRATVFREKGWLTEDQTVLDLLKEGYAQFELNVANRIVVQSPDKVFFNHCPKCNKLARTPRARQGRFCGHSWHEAPDV